MARGADARALFAAGRYDAAYYLAGLAVECALKARIARDVRRFTFPDRRLAERAFTHDLKKLLDSAGLKSDLENAPDVIQIRWDLVFNWSVDVRYKSGLSADDCSRYLRAIFGPGGILPWLKQRW
jgi:HEPN domain-containing protein